MHTPLQKYFSQRIKNLFNSLHEFELTGSASSMHDFRVEIKKLRAVERFLKKIYPKKEIRKSIHLLRAIFYTGGEIREFQLMQGWLRKSNLSVLERLYFPDETLQDMILAFRTNAHRYKKDLSGIIEILSKYVPVTNRILAEQYFTDIHARIQENISDNPENTEWHELRKFLKQWMYVNDWVGHTDKEENDFLFSYYNRLQEAIGQWHDLEMIKHHFAQKQIYLSQDIAVQKEFGIAWNKLTKQFKQKERNVEMLFARYPENKTEQA